MEAIYKDSKGEIHTQLINTPTEDGRSLLSIELNGIFFEGHSFDDFKLVNPSNYSNEQLARFTLNRGDLCNCTLTVFMPIILINQINHQECTSFLTMSLQLGSPTSNGGIDHEMASFSLMIEEQHYQSEGGDFEVGFDKLSEQIGNTYCFKNCYGCLYADYSPYGLGFFNSMLCFKQQKEAYLSLSGNFSKAAYFDIINQGTGFVQETYYCNEFEIRKRGTGYRS